ncbi:MAG: response regulator [Burkholderiales bacterium]|nr:response regulator [Burkholderiales bacterium]MDE2078054.1 response regulator [Burkholderiales bacterium]MDE2432472.1 response regulator [Burkholderiales bacterium]
MKRVLIVEDQVDIRELVRLTLELEDFDIQEADNGDEGLALATQWRPDLILLDVMMPGSLDGIAVCKRIKGDPSMKKVKVIILSAKGQDSDRHQGQQAGADGYLTKPFSPKQLLETVTKFIG